jgi:hypothetical protein
MNASERFYSPGFPWDCEVAESGGQSRKQPWTKRIGHLELFDTKPGLCHRNHTPRSRKVLFFRRDEWEKLSAVALPHYPASKPADHSPSGLVSCDRCAFCGCGLCQLLLYPTTCKFLQKNMPFWLLGAWFLWAMSINRTSFLFSPWSHFSPTDGQGSNLFLPYSFERWSVKQAELFSQPALTRCKWDLNEPMIKFTVSGKVTNSMRDAGYSTLSIYTYMYINDCNLKKPTCMRTKLI